MNWRPVFGWEGWYEVSDTGEVRSIDRRVPNSRGFDSFVRGRPLRVRLVSGYPQVQLMRPGQAWDVKVHRLVLEAFTRPRPEGLHCRHLNGDRTDNRVENLAWGTPKENGADKATHGSLKGRKNGKSRFTAFQAFMLREIPAHIPHRDLACKFGVSSAAISAIRRGANWAWL